MPGRGGCFRQLRDKSPPTKPGRGSSALLERSPSALRNIWSSSLLERHRVREALLALSWDAKPNAPPAGEAGGGVSAKKSDGNAGPGRARGNQGCRLLEQRRDSLRAKRLLQTPLPPTQGRARWRAWTDVSTSWAPGVSAKTPAPQAGARRGRPACAAEWPRVERSAGGCLSTPRAHGEAHRKWRTGGIYWVGALAELNRATAAWVASDHSAPPSIRSSRRSTLNHKGTHLPLSRWLESLLWFTLQS